MQFKAASEKARKIWNRWEVDRRQIEDLFLEAGLPRISDSLITKQMEDHQQRTESIVEHIRETTRSRCFQTTAPEAFEKAWTVVAGSYADA